MTVDADGTLKVRLRSAPVEGAANAKLVAVLAEAFDLPRRAITIAGGAHSRTKRVVLEGIDERRAAAVLATVPSSRG